MLDFYLVYSALNGVVEDAGHEERLDVARLHVQLARNEADLDPGVGLD